MVVRNRQWVLERRPRGQVREDDFRLVEAEVPALRDGQAVRTGKPG